MVESTRPAYDALRARFRSWVETEGVRARLAHESAESRYLDLRARIVEDAIRLDLDADFDLSGLPIQDVALFSRYLSANVVMDREDVRVMAIDDALDGHPGAAWTQFMNAHNDDDLALIHAMVAEMLGKPKGRKVVHTASSLAALFQSELVFLVDAARDRLGMVTHTLPQHCPPSITEEEVKADATLVHVLRHWEKAHGATYRQLCEEKTELEACLATPGLDMAYWWSRGALPGLDDCNVVRPALALVLARRRSSGIAHAGITVDALYEAVFPVEE